MGIFNSYVGLPEGNMKFKNSINSTTENVAKTFTLSEPLNLTTQHPEFQWTATRTTSKGAQFQGWGYRGF
jgi:hypothetical protein